MKFDSFGISDIGLIRETNEDHFAILKEERFFAIADGMGGHQAGEVAAKEAIAFICRAVQELLSTSPDLETEQLEKFIQRIYQNANAWVHHLAKQLDQYYGMGTTLSSILLHNKHLITSHIGDSRIYLLRSNQLQLLTKDHAAFDIDPSRQIQRKVLTQIIGSKKKVATDTKILPLQPKDLILICSDGLSDHVQENTLCDILSSQASLKEKGNYLVDRAKSLGSHDNITTILVELD